MTILRHEKIQIISRGKPINRFRNKITIQCDNCRKEKVFEKASLVFIEKTFHYCCRACFHTSMSGGVSDQLRRQKFKEKTGYEYPTQLSSVRDIIIENNLSKYGVENVSQIVDVKEKKKNTTINNYGVSSPLQSKQILDKVQKTNIEKYGGLTPMSDPKIVDKLKDTVLKQYGVDNVSKSIEIQNKKEQTLLENYGVSNPMFSDEIKSKIDYSEIWKKAHKTKKKNGTYKSSQIENRMYEDLCKHYGQENVEHQIMVNGWLIDFYVKHINTYIQFDGVYWHGLTIKIQHNPHSIRILKTIKTDITQNEWFKNNNMCLIRITDKQYETLSLENIIKLIEKSL